MVRMNRVGKALEPGQVSATNQRDNSACRTFQGMSHQGFCEVGDVARLPRFLLDGFGRKAMI
jgi:hypothetical protein